MYLDQVRSSGGPSRRGPEVHSKEMSYSPLRLTRILQLVSQLEVHSSLGPKLVMTSEGHDRTNIRLVRPNLGLVKGSLTELLHHLNKQFCNCS